jgi:uncharacterized protein (DUF305 family)
MTPSYRYRFTILTASMAAALALSACQPKTEDINATPTEEVMPPAVETPESENGTLDPHAGHDMAGEMGTDDEAEMTDMLKDYTKSMSRMNDEMMIGMGYNDPDTAFAKSMLGHHRGAVDMAKIELKYGTDDEMRKLAQAIIDAQQIEIDTMKKWLASHPDVSKPKPETQAMQQAYADGMAAMHDEMMLGIADPVADMAFARGMLPHHVGAVAMAKVQLKYGTDEEMRQLAQAIIDAQQPEIKLMQDWIDAHKADIGDISNIPDSFSEPNEAVAADKTAKASAS